MLMTPLIRLQETLRAAKDDYQNAAVYGEYQDLTDAREQLMDSRQRLQELLLAKGLLKIEGAFERVKTAAMNGQHLSGEGERLQKELEQLIAEASAQEQANWRIELGELGLSEPSVSTETEGTDAPKKPISVAKSVAIGGAILPFIPEVTALIAIVVTVVNILRKNDAKREAERKARENAERMAAYYRWVNELRDQEASAKASYEKTVREVLQQCYDSKLKAIDQKLAETNSTCAEHTENLEVLSALQLKVGEELAALSTAI